VTFLELALVVTIVRSAPALLVNCRAQLARIARLLVLLVLRSPAQWVPIVQSLCWQRILFALLAITAVQLVFWQCLARVKLVFIASLVSRLRPIRAAFRPFTALRVLPSTSLALPVHIVLPSS
jgi:hypothetical protein